ncbi:MAG: hypothetical protein A2428_01070 [Bdellovibrionales bacterium RIFOXYC1_FULL_54_43]|nr:MAG: hypothetical protein A2428_01070 [Bdellovibrionales bacterium RIFOXYC1_FULL_54_43]OFZ82875.1 MAG: hypothetical protein A2603_11790 [Bdellovibrionales bacterium RIFOXYD1_FULL_55_31]
MLDTQGIDIASITDEEFQRLLSGIHGVLAHEYSHPKQDELVKWDWRQAQDASRQNHGQADEMATDLMSMRTHKDAELPPENVLEGLNLVLGEPKTGNLGQRAGGALVSSHPQDNLRLNIIRGGLSKLRQDEGRAKPKPIPTNSEIKNDLSRLLSLNQTGERIATEIATRPGSRFINTLKHLREELEMPRDYNARNTFSPRQQIRAHFQLLKEAGRAGPSFSDAEIKEFISFTDYSKMAGFRRILPRSGTHWRC